jgi:outer membrane receptor for ferrienterochelin and colicins
MDCCGGSVYLPYFINTMRKIILPVWLLFFCGPVMAQMNLTAKVTDAATGEALAGATVLLKNTKTGGLANRNGVVSIANVPSGIQVLQTSFIGYDLRLDTLNFPLNDTLRIILFVRADEMDEVVISSTRSSRTIKDIPTRVEFIAGEELDEKANMKPGDIRVILSESTGIQMQTTSATSANASIRIQGLDGRYTQILKDGLPLYSGAASGLGLLQIPPLDLKQVELIKGSASTLYGGGAIAGLVNLISKTPTDERELNFHINATGAKGLDLNGFYGQKFGKFGTTIFASHNSNKAYDPSDIGLSAIPKFERVNFNPRIFFYPSDKTTINLGLNTTFEDRVGGDMHYINGNADVNHSYFERNETKRLSSQFALDHQFGKCSHIQVKNSISYFNRKLNSPGYEFNGSQYSSFTELSYASHGDKMEWIGGLNLWTDQFKEDQIANAAVRDYQLNTTGAFLQNNWMAKKWLNIETGLRTDYVFDYGFVLLPRVSALFKINPKLSSRLGGGFGYKAPTIFTEESERIQYKNLLPVNQSLNKLERSYGGNWDVNYRTVLFGDKISMSINQLFFYTYISNPLLLAENGNATYQFNNIDGHIDTKGTETNVKLGYHDFKLLLGYTFTNSRINENDRSRENFLTPKHRVNGVLFYEADEQWKLGLEAYYFSRQKLSDGLTGRDYLITGFMAERLWERFSIYINFENFLDATQTRFDSIYTGAITNPVFRDIYAPLDGFVINGGIKFRL